MTNLSFAAVVVVSCAVALCVMRSLAEFGLIVQPAGRYAPLDGLRGFAAFAVYLHHATGWRHLSSIGRFSFEPSLSAMLGPFAVELFFMTTAFLFVDKVVFARRPTDWLHLYCSRVLRMLPLYLLTLTLLLMLIACELSFRPRDGWPGFVLSAARWLPLGLFGTPDIDHVDQTWLRTAGVLWTLRYECFFYFLLPTIALFANRTVPLAWVLWTVVCAGLLYAFRLSVDLPLHDQIRRLLPFVSGGLAAVLIQHEPWRRWAGGRIASGVAVAALACCTSLSYLNDFRVTFGFSTVAFLLISGGSSLFGLLTTVPARLLGQISYSVYLLHGLALYVVVGRWLPPTLSDAAYWGSIVALSIPLLVVSATTFSLVERPFMSNAGALTSAIRQRLVRLPVGTRL